MSWLVRRSPGTDYFNKSVYARSNQCKLGMSNQGTFYNRSVGVPEGPIVMMPNKKWQMQIRDAVVPSGDLRGMIDHDRQRCALGINRGEGCYLARLDDRGGDWNILHAVARHHECRMR